MSQIRKQTHLGKLLRMQMDKLQLFLGTEQHFLTLSSDEFKYTEPSRMQFLWEENTKRGVRIKVANAWRQKPIRDGDKALMDEFRRIRIQTEKLRRMNDVRLYLKVTYLSCMTNVKGNKIERWALYGPPVRIAN